MVPGLTRRGESGAVLLVVSMLLVVTMAMASIVVDLGEAREELAQSQVTADSAALAGAQDFSTLAFPAGWSTVISDVETYGSENAAVSTSAWAGCSDAGALTYTPDSSNHDTCISSNSSSAPTTLRVKLPGVTVPASFAKMFGDRSFSVNATAEAVLASGSAPCSLCLLNGSGTGLALSSSSADVAVTANGSATVGPGIIIDSSASGALSLSGSSDTVSAPSIGVVGTASATGAGDSWTPAPTTGITAVADPLAGLAVPSVSGQDADTCPDVAGAIALALSSESCTLGPGVYLGVALSGSSESITLESGTYVFTTTGISLSGSSDTLTGTGVTMYFGCVLYPTACTSGQAGAALSLSSSSATFSVSPPTSGTYQGVTVFYDRNNSSALALSGSSADTVTGTIYAKSSHLALSSSSAGTFSLNSMIVVGSATLSGSSATIDLTYKGANNIPFGSPAELSE